MLHYHILSAVSLPKLTIRVLMRMKPKFNLEKSFQSTEYHVIDTYLPTAPC